MIHLLIEISEERGKVFQVTRSVNGDNKVTKLEIGLAEHFLKSLTKEFDIYTGQTSVRVVHRPLTFRPLV